MTDIRSISDVFTQYNNALNLTRERLEKRILSSRDSMEKFYPNFLHDKVVNAGELFSNEDYRRDLHQELREAHRTNKLRFWAIDGACAKTEAADLMVFFGGAYVTKGTLDLQDDPPLIRYSESEPEDDNSLVAYLPIDPMDLVVKDAEERFISSDKERLQTSGLESSLMLLAEIYMCYRGSGTPGEHPHIIVWDHSISSMLANASPNVTELRFVGAKIAGQTVYYPDLLVGYSLPWNEKLDVPGKKLHALWQRLIAKIYSSSDRKVDLVEFSKDVGQPLGKVISQTKIIWERDQYNRLHSGGNPPGALVHKDGNILKLNDDYLQSPDKVETLFTHFCKAFFHEKDPDVLLYEYLDPYGNSQLTYLGPEQLSFLMAIGLRLTFKNCWKRGIRFVGLSKDSNSVYFTRNYLAVLREAGHYKFESEHIPPTDRFLFEMVPYVDEDIIAPWSSIEFDSTFMTLRYYRENDFTKPYISGIRGDVLLQPNLMMRSLVQFFIRRDESMEPLMSHVIFLDRLIDPSKMPPTRLPVTDEEKVYRELGRVDPFVNLDNTVSNREQEITLYLLDVMTKNTFPEVIGYPDPLHYADRGAKAIQKMVWPMLKSSESLGRANPLHRTLRQTRGG